MPFNGSGGTSQPAGSIYPATANTLIESAKANVSIADLYTMMASVICKDGQTTITQNIPFNSKRITGLGAGITNGDALRYEQLFSTSAVQLLGSMEWVKGADVSSAATTNLTTATGNAVHVTGTTPITAVTLGTGMWRIVIFDGALTLTHHATNNNLPGAANITTAAGDRALYWADGTTVYCISYIRAATGATPTKQPTRTVLTSGSSATYTTPAGATRINVRLVGGGGGGAGATANTGTTGNDTTFGTLTGSGGIGGTANGGAGGAGGAASGGDINISGNAGISGQSLGGSNVIAGAGGGSAFGGAPKGGAAGTAADGTNGATNSGAGGSGGSSGTSSAGGGGGSGGYVEKLFTAPSATYTYTVGAAANGGAAGGQKGGNGAAGIIVVDEYYN